MPKKILIVPENDVPCLEGNKKDLKKEGFEIEVRKTPNNLVKYLETNTPDALLLGCKFLDNDGLDVLQDVRDKFYNLPIILYTQYDTFKEKLKSVAADEYVIASFDATELLTKIRRNLDQQLIHSIATILINHHHLFFTWTFIIKERICLLICPLKFEKSTEN